MDRTNPGWRNAMIYCVFVRQYTEEGTIRALEADLDRIASLGTDILWLMPVYPIGQTHRKGTLGSPYAISNYMALDPEQGNLQDFLSLVHAAHDRHMRVMLDIVFHHTSPDAVYTHTHPEWYVRNSEGRLCNRIGDWWDVVDLDFDQPELWDELISVLCFWARFVDGFRCDVAPLVPLAFWETARDAVAKVNPECLWLAESVEPSFILYNRANGVFCHSDGELYRAFDFLYDYDVFSLFQGFLDGANPLAAYVQAVQAQEYLYPGNFVKLRFLENHDRQRAAALIPDPVQRRAWMAFLFFQHGPVLLYAGQEFSDAHTPSLFEKDEMRRDGEDLSDFMRLLLPMHRSDLIAGGAYRIQSCGEKAILAWYTKEKQCLIGLFPVAMQTGEQMEVEVPCPDGRYDHLLGMDPVTVQGGRVCLGNTPLIFVVEAEGESWTT